MTEYWLTREGAAFHSFLAGSEQAADETARLKGWEPVRHEVDASGRHLLHVQAPPAIVW